MEGVTKAPSSSEEGVGGGEPRRQVMFERARQLRNNPTTPETKLWSALRASQVSGHKFRRQARIENRIADFFCPAKRLIVEVDGDTHDRDADLKRDAAIERRLGYRTVRFTNGDVMGNLDGVVWAIANALDDQPDRWPAHHPPAPSSEEEGEI